MSSGIEGNVSETYAPMAARMTFREERKHVHLDLDLSIDVISDPTFRKFHHF